MGDRNANAGVMTFLVLGLLIPVLMFDPEMRAGVFNAFLSLVILEISALRISVLVARGEPRLLWLGVHLFVYPFFGVATLAQTTSYQFPLEPSTYSLSTITVGLFVILAGLLAVEAGAMLTFRRGETGRKPSHRRWEYSQGRVVVLSLAGLAFVIYAVATTGFAPYFTSRDAATSAIAGTDEVAYAIANKTSFLLLRTGTRYPIFVALVAMLVMLRNGTWRYGYLGKPATIAMLGLVVAGNLVVNNPVSTSRALFGMVAIALLAVYIPWRTGAGFRFLAWSALLVFVFAFALLDYFRRTETEAVIDYSPRSDYLTDGSYSAFQTLLNGVDYLRSAPHSGGEQILGAVFTFVPRSFWSGKPSDTGSLIDTNFNRASTLWTELQVDFTVIGVVVGMFALGLLISRFDQRLPDSEIALAMLSPLLMSLMVVLLRGSLVSALAGIYALLITYAFVLKPGPTRATNGQARNRALLSRSGADQ